MNREAPRWKYICVWFLAGIVNRILSTLIFTIINLNMTINNLDDLNSYFVMISVVSGLISIGVVVCIYNIFHNINMKKVFPYLVVFGGLATLASVGEMQQNLRELNLDVDLTTYRVSAIISFIVIMFVIRAYYIRKPDRWY